MTTLLSRIFSRPSCVACMQGQGRGCKCRAAPHSSRPRAFRQRLRLTTAELILLVWAADVAVVLAVAYAVWRWLS